MGEWDVLNHSLGAGTTPEGGGGSKATSKGVQAAVGQGNSVHKGRWVGGWVNDASRHLVRHDDAWNGREGQTWEESTLVQVVVGDGTC